MPTIISRGFTLLELMITLSISTILITLSYPLYVQYETGAKRNQATVTLMQLAARLEAYFTDNNSYANATPEALGIAELDQHSDYHFELTDLSDQHFTIQAVPQNEQAKRDTCGTLTLTDTNEKTSSGGGDASACWG